MHQIPAIVSYLESLRWPTNKDVYFSSPRPEGDELKIVDFEGLRSVLERAKISPAVITPKWILDGFIDSFHGKGPKYCPYLLSPSVGSRFLVQPNGDVKVCSGEPIGYFVAQTPQQIVHSATWREKLKEFEACAGFWNSCYTLFSKMSRYGVDEVTCSFRLVRYFGGLTLERATAV